MSPSVNVSETLLIRLTVEDFIYREAGLLDEWKLKEWLALFAADARYEVAPTGDAEAGSLSSAESLFLIADDRERLEQRVIRLLKPQAHAEYPYSRVRHLYSNVRILAADVASIDAVSNFVTFRTKRGITATYMGWHHWNFERVAEGLLIRLKRTILDLDGLVPQGKVSLLL
jgi:p-cumate 2,3-dioxygenase beta subunit